MDKLEKALNGYYGHDFHTSAAAADAADAFCAVEAWGGAAAVTYNLYLPQSNSTVARTTTIPAGQRVVGRISNLVVVSGTVAAYNYFE